MTETPRWGGDVVGAVTRRTASDFNSHMINGHQGMVSGVFLQGALPYSCRKHTGSADGDGHDSGAGAGVDWERGAGMLRPMRKEVEENRTQKD
jgi:hypothetical protein